MYDRRINLYKWDLLIEINSALYYYLFITFILLGAKYIILYLLY